MRIGCMRVSQEGWEDFKELISSRVKIYSILPYWYDEESYKKHKIERMRYKKGDQSFLSYCPWKLIVCTSDEFPEVQKNLEDDILSLPQYHLEKRVTEINAKDCYVLGFDVEFADIEGNSLKA